MRLIDADALKDKLQQHHDFWVMAWGGFSKMPISDKKRVDEITNCIAEVVNAPTIEPKRGKWIDEADKYDASFGIHDYRCSNCNSYADEYIGGHEWYTAGKPNFCPYCGADMREREDE